MSNINENEKFQKTVINWYPGHMAKAKRLIKENIDKIDVVIEVLDARIPYSTKIRDFEELVQNKPRILVFTKMDLCDKKETEKWIKYYEQLGNVVVALDLEHQPNMYILLNKIKMVMQETNAKRVAKGMNIRKTRVLIVGVPNAGKSTLINRLVGKKVTNVGNKPGVTKNLNFLPTKYGITLLDSPGILWPKLDNIVHAYNMATIGSIKKEVLNISDIGMYIINFYLKSYPNILKDIYKTSETDAIEVFDNLSLKWGFTKNGETDFTKVSERLYNDIIGGKIKGITLDEEKTDN